MKTQTTVIVGNALSGMIAALELGKKGHQVTLINPGGPLGGYFAGITINEIKFDAGLVKFELDGYANQAKLSELATYDATLRNDVGRFMQIVHDWALKYVPLNQLSMPKMMIKGQVYDDVVLSNAYHSFAQLPFAAESIKELSHKNIQPEIHAKNKAFGARYDTLDYQTASIANHGETMHKEIIAAYLIKAQFVTADQVLARYHRVTWLPLFYPETLLKSFKGEAVSLQPTKFHYPKSDTIGGIVNKVKDEILAIPNIKIVNQAVQKIHKTANGWKLECTDAEVVGNHLAWTYQPAVLLQALGQTPKTVDETKSAIALLFLRIKKSDIRNFYSILHVLDLDKSIYRITNQTAGSGDDGDMNIVAEFNTDYFNTLYGAQENDVLITNLLLKELAAMQLITENTTPIIAQIKRIPGGFLVPNALARDAWEENQQQVKQYFPEIALLAMASGFFATSINDQVVQGLHYACVLDNKLKPKEKERKELKVCL